MKKTKRVLKLRSEIVRQLDERALTNVEGGAYNYTYLRTCLCDTTGPHQTN